MRDKKIRCIVLKQDIIIPAGTCLVPAPELTRRSGIIGKK